jgi:predicted aldo/keto reductase-like oxidoreductase
MIKQYTRRQFLDSTFKGTGGLALNTIGLLKGCSSIKLLERRTLGRTGIKISVIGLGFGPLGIGNYSQSELLEVSQAALNNECVTYFDVQPDYGNAEQYLAPLLRTHRDNIFLATKIWEKSREAVLSSVKNSVRRMGVDYVDAVLLNNLGSFDLNQVFSPDGVLSGLKEAQKQELVRFIGASGHMKTENFVQALDSGEFDIVMPVINFVDRHTYNFEEKVLPIAVKHRVGIVAMKVLGGAVSLDYSTREQRGLLLGEDYEPAIHYALNVPNVSTAIIGCKSIEEIRLAQQAALRYHPMKGDKLDGLLKRGKQLASQWGAHFGPV